MVCDGTGGIMGIVCGQWEAPPRGVPFQMFCVSVHSLPERESSSPATPAAKKTKLEDEYESKEHV